MPSPYGLEWVGTISALAISSCILVLFASLRFVSHMPMFVLGTDWCQAKIHEYFGSSIIFRHFVRGGTVVSQPLEKHAVVPTKLVVAFVGVWFPSWGGGTERARYLSWLTNVCTYICIFMYVSLSKPGIVGDTWNHYLRWSNINQHIWEVPFLDKCSQWDWTIYHILNHTICTYVVQSHTHIHVKHRVLYIYIYTSLHVEQKPIKSQHPQRTCRVQVEIRGG